MLIEISYISNPIDLPHTNTVSIPETRSISMSSVLDEDDHDDFAKTGSSLTSVMVLQSDIIR